MEDHELEMTVSSLPASARNYYRTNGDLPAADQFGHRTRFSDASSYDEICVLCGGTDRFGDPSLNKKCCNACDDLPGTKPPAPERGSPARLEEALEQIRLYVEAGAMHLQASAPDGNNPAGYKGPHPCDCNAFADDVVEIIRSLVLEMQPGSTVRVEVPQVKPPELRPYLSPIEMGTLDALSRAAHPGNIAIAPFSAQHESWLMGEDKDSFMGIVTIATGMNMADAAYMVGLWRADRRLRSRA